VQESRDENTTLAGTNRGGHFVARRGLGGRPIGLAASILAVDVDRLPIFNRLDTTIIRTTKSILVFVSKRPALS
jgi:hypothetical protein